jgi:hypothetical protein
MTIINILVLKTFLVSGHYIHKKCGFHGCDYENYSLLGRTNLPTFWRKLLPSLCRKMKIQDAGSSETSSYFFQTAWHHNHKRH